MTAITTHVLDTSRGHPAVGVPVTLEMHLPDESWKRLSGGVTDGDGRLKFVLPPGFVLQKGAYRLIFDTAAYHRTMETDGLYPQVTIAFVVRDPAQHFHIPLLLSPHGYTTYRGS